MEVKKITSLNKHKKALIVGVIVIISYWGLNNFINIRRYEHVVSTRIRSIIHPATLTPEYFSRIAEKGEISKQTLEYLNRTYMQFVANAGEVERLGRDLNQLPESHENQLSKTADAIYQFINKIYSDTGHKNLRMAKLDDNQVEKLLLLQELSDAWRAVENTYVDIYNDKLYDARKPHWIDMHRDMNLVIDKFEEKSSLSLRDRFLN